MSIGYIYCITNKVNGKRYVGECYNRPYEKRWKEHINDLNKNKHYNEHLQRSWNNYGEENFEFTLLEAIECTKEELDELEKQYIREWNLLNGNYGYNTAEGGNGGNLIAGKTEEEKKSIHKKISDIRIEKGLAKGKNNPMYGRKFTEEHKKKMSEALKGRPCPMEGKHHTEESKKKMSEAKKGINTMANKSEEEIQEWKNKLSEANKGKVRSDETKKKISEATKGKREGENNPMYGKPGGFKGKTHTEEELKKMSEAMKGRKFTEDHRRKLSEARKGKYSGENSPMYGKHHNEESRKKMSENRKGKGEKKVRCVETKQEFNSIKEATKSLGKIDSTNISACLRGKQRTAYGYHWEYVED